MVRLPRISLGTKKRKNYFDLSHDVETTSGFGFCQPTIVRHMNAGSSSSLTTKIGVRLAPLPQPTFGRIKLKTYNTLVPIQDVFLAYDYMQKKTSVQSSSRSYIPDTADHLSNRMLFSLILYQSLYAQDVYHSGIVSPSNIGIKPFLNFTLATPDFSASNLYIRTIEGTTRANIEFNDITTLSAVGAKRGYGYSFSDLSVALYNAFFNELDTSWNCEDIFNTFFNSFSFPSSLDNFDVNSSVFTGFYDIRAGNKQLDTYINTRPNSDSYDFLLYNDYLNFDFEFEGITYQVEFPVAVYANWTFYGQRLVKVLNACGIRGFHNDYLVDLNKFYAYYKAWFDNLNPGRTQQWRETNCYYLIHQFYDEGITMDYYWQNSQSPFNSNVTSERILETFIDFLVDLVDCCYVLPIDNFTAATSLPIQQVGNVQSVELASNSSGTGNTIYSGNNQEVYPFAREDENLNGLAVQALLRLYKLANKNSVIGARIEEYLRTKFGYTIEKSNILQGSEMDVRIDEIFASAGTSENYLGELGGVGSRSNGSSGNCKFECDKPSIFVQFFCIVPYGDYVQGFVKGKFSRNDFYQEDYDSLGKEALSKYEVLARTSDLTVSAYNASSFGFVPMFWRDKVQNSLHNGGFALNSQRPYFIGYSLDRLFNERRKFFDEVIGWSIDEGSVVTPSEELRYVERQPDFGNYDRIFVDTTGMSDNFIVHIIEDWDYYANMKPISQSFETFDDENDDSSTSVTAS